MNNPIDHEVTRSVDLCWFDLLLKHSFRSRSGVSRELPCHENQLSTTAFYGIQHELLKPMRSRGLAQHCQKYSKVKYDVAEHMTWHAMHSLCKKDQPWISPGQAAPANDRLLIQRAEDQPTPSCHLEGEMWLLLRTRRAVTFPRNQVV